MPRPKVPVQPSMRIAMQQQMKEAGMPNDVGLLDGAPSPSASAIYMSDSDKEHL